MIKSIHNQRYYTEAFLQAAGIDAIHHIEYEKVWWWNYTTPTTLRLNKFGLNFVQKNTQLPIYTFDLPTPLSNKNLIQLSRFFTCPYFIKNIDSVLLLGKEEATMLKLHADNLQQYLNNMQI